MGKLYCRLKRGKRLILLSWLQFFLMKVNDWCLSNPILNNEPVLKRKKRKDYTAPESTESPEALKEDPTMTGQGATAKQIAANIAQVTLAISRERDEE